MRKTKDDVYVYSLKETRKRFDEHRAEPKRLFQKKDFDMSPPGWLLRRPADQLNLLFKNRRELYREGIVVWGALVQANSLLFNPKSPYSCPGEVVFSLDLDSNPDYLKDIAQHLYGLKEGGRDNAEEERIGSHLENEMTREFGLRVPESISPDLPCLLSTTFFQRNQLPGRCLRDRVFPIVASPKAPHFIAPLPPKFWETSIREAWESRKR